MRSPIGAVLRRSPRTLTRRECDALVRAWAPLMTDVYPDGLLWWDGEDALARWAEVSPLVVRRRLPSVHEGWIAHAWESDDGDRALHLTGWH